MAPFLKEFSSAHLIADSRRDCPTASHAACNANTSINTSTTTIHNTCTNYCHRNDNVFVTAVIDSGERCGDSCISLCRGF
jgi:hypothetical protein